MNFFIKYLILLTVIFLPQTSFTLDLSQDLQKILVQVEKMNCPDAGKISPEKTQQIIQIYKTGKGQGCILGIIYNAKGEPIHRYLVFHEKKAFTLNDARKNSFRKTEKIRMKLISALDWGYWDKLTQKFIAGPIPQDPAKSKWAHPNVIGVQRKVDGKFMPFY